MGIRDQPRTRTSERHGENTATTNLVRPSVHLRLPLRILFGPVHSGDADCYCIPELFLLRVRSRPVTSPPCGTLGRVVVSIVLVDQGLCGLKCIHLLCHRE
jgi:hypothetical protein